MLLRTLFYDADTATYDIVIKTEAGDHYTQVDEYELSGMIDDAPKGDRARILSLRRMTHRFPCQWVPIEAADGRAA
jgi:hypothetical protein